MWKWWAGARCASWSHPTTGWERGAECFGASGPDGVGGLLSERFGDVGAVGADGGPEADEDGEEDEGGD